MRTIMTFLACFALTSLATGCSFSSEYCDAKCECEGCSDRDYDECLIVRDAEEDKADAFGCGDLYAITHDCTMANNDCELIAGIDFFRPEPECADELVDLDDCIDDNSALR